MSVTRTEVVKALCILERAELVTWDDNVGTEDGITISATFSARNMSIHFDADDFYIEWESA